MLLKLNRLANQICRQAVAEEQNQASGLCTKTTTIAVDFKVTIVIFRCAARCNKPREEKEKNFVGGWQVGWLVQEL